MAANDLSVREELIAEGSLGKQGYHPRMEAVHKINAARLATIIEQHGWPGRSFVGDDGAEATWLIAQHSIGNPTFMRHHCLSKPPLTAKFSCGSRPCWRIGSECSKASPKSMGRNSSRMKVDKWFPIRLTVPAKWKTDGVRLA